MANTEEWTDGAFAGNLGEVLVRYLAQSDPFRVQWCDLFLSCLPPFPELRRAFSALRWIYVEIITFLQPSDATTCCMCEECLKRMMMMTWRANKESLGLVRQTIIHVAKKDWRRDLRPFFFAFLDNWAPLWFAVLCKHHRHMRTNLSFF